MSIVFAVGKVLFFCLEHLIFVYVCMFYNVHFDLHPGSNFIFCHSACFSPLSLLCTFMQSMLQAEELAKLKVSGGSSLADLMALYIGELPAVVINLIYTNP